MRKIFKIPLYVLGFLMVGLVSGHLTFKLLSSSKEVEVPDLKGKSLTEAVNQLQLKGLYLHSAVEDFDAEVPPGYIIRQDIPAPNKVKEGRGVKVAVSKGPRVQYVPSVVGMKLSEAETLLVGRGIRIAKVIYVHGNVEKDTIIAQRPESEEKGGDQFRVLVSLGAFEEDKR